MIQVNSSQKKIGLSEGHGHSRSVPAVPVCKSGWRHSMHEFTSVGLVQIKQPGLKGHFGSHFSDGEGS